MSGLITLEHFNVKSVIDIANTLCNEGTYTFCHCLNEHTTSINGKFPLNNIVVNSRFNVKT